MTQQERETIILLVTEVRTMLAEPEFGTVEQAALLEEIADRLERLINGKVKP